MKIFVEQTKRMLGIGLLMMALMGIIYYFLSLPSLSKINLGQMFNNGKDFFQTSSKGEITNKMTTPVTHKSELEAYLVGGDKNSLEALNNNLDIIDVLLPVWLSLDPKDQSLKQLEHKAMLAVIKEVKQKKADMKVMVVINNYRNDLGKWDADGITALLNDTEKEEKLIGQIVDFLQENSLDGISVDFESIKKDDQERYVQFLAKLKTKLEISNDSLSVSLPLSDEKYNYKEISEIVDEVILMAYDEHWATGTAGPIASQKWFEMELNKIAIQIPAEKLVIGLASYAYDWSDKGKIAKTLTYTEASQLAKKRQAEISMDQESLNTFFEYTDNKNNHHIVYMLEVASIFNEKQFGETIRPKGYSIWRIGSEDSAIWSVLGQDGRDESLKEINKALEIEKREVIFDGLTGRITEVKYH